MMGSATPSACNQDQNAIAAARASGSGLAFTCASDAPWRDAIDATVSYGYAAVPDKGACGQCFELEFSGAGFYDAGQAGGQPLQPPQPGQPPRDDTRDAGSMRLRGKRMIVQASNTGTDVHPGQFDLMIPAGGVGIFDACSVQWGVGARGVDLGERYGGILASCSNQLQRHPVHPACAGSSGTRRYNNTACHQAISQCVAGRCQDIFAPSHLSRLRAACEWFHSWFEAANDPTMRYRKVECPAEAFEGGIRAGSSATPLVGMGTASTIIG